MEKPMTVYVDDVEIPFGRMLMCHLWADSLDELLAMVDTIGVQRKWIQGHQTLSLPQFRKASWVHFDIAKGMRARAVKAGAIETDMFGPTEHTANLNIATGDPALVAYGTRKLEQIKASRAMR
jgi:hypothetical protein